MPKEKIGLMGGSFNPIHERHLEMASCALKEAKLDRVLFLPTGNPPHKKTGLEEATNIILEEGLVSYILESGFYLKRQWESIWWYSF